MKNQAPALPLRTPGPPISNSVGIRKEIILPRSMIFLSFEEEKEIDWSVNSRKLDVPTNPATPTMSKFWIHVYR